ncbi:MAG: hypothetical protein NZT61_00165 [Deltaproteobacteria bacterium]|nr:hypothetical protein [Deltaproteobacteria bacterium]
MKLLGVGVFPFQESVNLKIFSVFCISKILEARNINPSVLVVSDSPFIGSIINLLTGFNTVTVDAMSFRKNQQKALYLASRGSEAVIVLFPSRDISFWIEEALSKSLFLVGSIDGSSVTELEKFCLQQLIQSGALNFCFTFSHALDNDDKMIMIEGYEPIIPDFGYTEYHIPKFDYAVIQKLTQSAVSGSNGKIGDLKSLIDVPDTVPFAGKSQSRLTIYFSEDSFFNFTFKENALYLNLLGHSVKTFSPTIQGSIPKDADLIWITGSNFLEVLTLASQTQKFVQSMREYVFSGKPVIIEGLSCGLLASALKFGNKKANGGNILNFSLNFSFSTGSIIDFAPSGKIDFFRSQLRGFNLNHFSFCDGESFAGAYYSLELESPDPLVDFYFPVKNVLCTQTYVPLYLNEDYAKNLLNWAKSCN